MSSNISLVLTGLSPEKTLVDPPDVDELSLILLMTTPPEICLCMSIKTSNCFKAVSSGGILIKILFNWSATSVAIEDESTGLGEGETFSFNASLNDVIFFTAAL